MDEAEYADRIAIIDHGAIIALDTPDDLKAAVGADTVDLETADDDAALDALSAGRLHGRADRGAASPSSWTTTRRPSARSWRPPGSPSARSAPIARPSMTCSSTSPGARSASSTAKPSRCSPGPAAPDGAEEVR